MNEAVLSCGIVLIRGTGDATKTLLLRAFHHWDFPKGMQEPGEEPLETALREVHEETAISDVEFPWGERYLETGPYAKGKIARYYLGTTETKDVTMGLSPETGEPEHLEWRWVSFDAAFDLGSPRVRTIVQWGRQIVGV